MKLHPKRIADKVKQRIPKRRSKDPKARLDEAIQSLPRITNDTIAAHREEVIGSARKYIYPLKHSLHRAVTISISIFLVFIILFFSANSPIINFTGLVIALTAVSLFSIGIGLTASEKPIKLKNLAWIPSIWAYWMLQMFIAGWAFLKLIFRSKRVWSKTVKKGFITSNLEANKPI